MTLPQEFPIMEVALSLETFADLASGHERKQEGDIIAVRYPLNAIGFKEAHTYLWMRIEGLEYTEFTELVDPLTDPPYGTDTTAEIIVYDKRRYSIPLSRIKEVHADFDIDRAKDINDLYQPFLTLDEDNFYFLSEHFQPFQVEGLVFDKFTGVYL